MHEMAMRISNTENCAQGRGSPATSGLAKTLAERNDALNLPRTLGAAGLRTTPGWPIARPLFRIGFFGAACGFSGGPLVDRAVGYVTAPQPARLLRLRKTAHPPPP